MITIKVYKGQPDAEMLEKIGKMIEEGYHTGIDMPIGANWEVNYTPSTNVITLDHCPMCKEDEKVFCPRDTDAQCLECGVKLCGAHIGQHLKEVHCIALNNDHCTKK